MSKTKPLRVVADLTLTSVEQEWTPADDGTLVKAVTFSGDGVSVRIKAPPKGTGMGNHWQMTLTEVFDD